MDFWLINWPFNILQKKNYLLEEVLANQLYLFLHMAKPKHRIEFIGEKHIFIFLSPTLHIVALNSASAWSISPADLIFMLRFYNKIICKIYKEMFFKEDIYFIDFEACFVDCFLTSLISANKVVVKWTVPSSSIGWFIRISFLKASLSGHLLPKPKGGSIFFNMSYISE